MFQLRRARSLREVMAKYTSETFPELRPSNPMAKTTNTDYPETVEEELHEDFGEATRCQSPPMRGLNDQARMFIEDFFENKRRKSAEYVNMLLSAPTPLKIGID